MHSILLVVEPPALHYSPNPNMQQEIRYKDVLTKLIELSKRNTNIQLLGDNVLLISIDKTLEPLSEAIGSLSSTPYKYTIFDEGLEWHGGSEEALYPELQK